MTLHVRLVSWRRVSSERASSYATASSETTAGCGGVPTDVRQFWLWRLKPMTGSTRSRSALEQLPLGRLEVQRIAVDVDELRVASLETLGAVGVEHRDDVQGQAVQQARDHRAPGDA